jgi:hypothetical protein
LDAADLLCYTCRLVNRKDETLFEDIALTSMLRASNGGFYFEIDNLDIDEEKVMLTNDQLARTLKLYGVN